MITFDPDLFSSGPVTILLTSTELVITDTAGQTTLTGPGSALLSISGGDATRVFRVGIGADLSLEGLAVVEGRTAGSGGMLNLGTTALTRVTFVSNRSLDDAGAVSNAGNLTISESTFSGNITSNDGGAIRSSGTLSIVNSTFSGNSAGIAGGAIRNDGSMTIKSSIVSNNASPKLGLDILTILSGGYNLIESTNGIVITGTTEGNILGQSALLGSVANNGGNALTMALQAGSPSHQRRRYGGRDNFAKRCIAHDDQP